MVTTQAGAAMIAVLMVVSALSILVAGMVDSQRSEVRAAGVTRMLVDSTAIGRAAIFQVLQRSSGPGTRVDRLQRTSVPFAGRTVVVDMQPMNGLIDINMAPAPLLQNLFVHAAGVPPDTAREVADKIVERRNARPFDAADDLAELFGLDSDTYARIRGLVATGTRGSGRVNPLAATLPVLMVAAGGNAAVATRFQADRDAGAVLPDTTRFDGALVDAGVSSRYRMVAWVPAPDGRYAQVLVEVDLGARSDGPWHVVQTSARLAEGGPG